jgi:outer membrane receptor protein involved in Fe transport
MKLRLLILIAGLFWGFAVLGQNPDPNAKNGMVSGKVIDASTKKPVEFATITVKHLKDSLFFTGGLTNATGEFSVEKLKYGKYLLTISFIGYQSKKDTILVIPNNLNVNAGTYSLVPDAKTLNTVTIEDEKDDFQLGIDKKIFNVDKNLVSAGGSAIDVLRQVPTLNVDIDGKISLRGSESLVIFINGKPSGLTAQNREQILMQIPASNIDRIELITNPSAKYDAEGMSGIINIITKKNIADGFSGNTTAGIGTNHKYNGSFTANYRTEKIATSNTIGFRYNQRFFNGYNLRTNEFNNQPTYSINQRNGGNTYNSAPTFSGNTEFFFNKHSLSLNYLFSYGYEDRPEDIEYEFLDSSDWVTRMYNRATKTIEETYSADGGITYAFKNPEKKRDLIIASNISYNLNFRNSYFTQQEKTLDNEIDTTYNTGLSNNYQTYRNLVSVTQLDYTHPFAKKYKFETGGKVTIRNLDNDFNADSLDYSLNTWVPMTSLINRFIYLENVNAIYGTFSGSIKEKFGYQLGLRVEQTNIRGNQVVGNIEFTKNYVNFFPSVFLSYKFNKEHEIQLNYSRRINRPSLGNINPFGDYEDPLNIRVGNPDLNPENIDAVEFNYAAQWKNHSILATAYFRHVDGLIQRYRNVDTITGVSTVSFINLDRSLNFGLEFVARNKFFKWWNSTANLNIFRNQSFGADQYGDLSATNFSYSVRWQNSFKFTPQMELQLTLNYNGPNTFPQGVMAEMWGIDAGYRLDILKGKLSFTLNVQDIFDTRRFAVDSFDDYFFGEVYRKRETRIATLQITYRFGKQQQNQQQQRRRSMDGGGDSDMGM